jgi:hypothetical protein
MISGYKKLIALFSGLVAVLYNHAGSAAATTGQSDVDKLLAALVAIYVAVEGLKDAVHGIATWWNVTDGAVLPRPPGAGVPKGD